MKIPTPKYKIGQTLIYKMPNENPRLMIVDEIFISVKMGKVAYLSAEPSDGSGADSCEEVAVQAVAHIQKVRVRKSRAKPKEFTKEQLHPIDAFTPLNGESNAGLVPPPETL